MKPTLKTSAAGRRLIKSFEGFRRKAASLPDGGWVIGYGHTKSAREGAVVSEDDADKLLIYDLLPVEATINELVSAPLTQNQFDALASLTLNIGRENFLNSTVLARLNDGNPLEAALAFDQWRATILDGQPVVVEALLRRRAAERALFLTPPGGPAAAPSPEVAAATENGAATLKAPVMNYRADLTGGAPGAFEPVQRPGSHIPPAPQAEPEPTDEFEPEEPQAEPEFEAEPQFEAAPEDNEEFAYEPEAELDETPPAPVRSAMFGAREPEPAPRDEPRADNGMARIEAAIEDDEPVEEVFVATAQDDLPPEELDEPEAAPQSPGMSWAEQVRARSMLARAQAEEQAEAAGPGRAEHARAVARREDLLLRNTEAEWNVEDDSEYSPSRDRSGVWYALFLLIGAALAGFGAWDTWQRASGAIDEAFVYGPAVAAAGVLFMAIAAWFLIKRMLAFR